MPKKTAKPSPRKNNKNYKPEQVYKVVPKRRFVTSKQTKKKHHKKTHTSFHQFLTWPIPVVVLVILAVAIIGSIFLAVRYAYVTVRQTIDTTNTTIADNAYSKDTVQRLRLIGKTENYPAEIKNYQSAPQDLQPFILEDYRFLKTQCIVNGAFAGPLTYEIVNVVYDSFARIEKNCNGADTLLLKKMSGTWTVIYRGNDLPKCSDVNAFGIPQGISYKCRDGFVTYTNPNP